ncbi:hypothetical protein BKA67DRAFT_69178 [Truncatella angustata]|uniref:Uncharacterized protein n=1 Tax=Truncatella angustata TaxID=152316 RepID=A0A9P8UX17_9PEZI|nr:uncharacterized protein BKA67DRAFT_69178 [Truncatella angustata]KAH6660879.1 hypothetical protein BKA67DRAFT_69178 [Truncatella angustata]
MGACCASTAAFQEYQSGDATGLYGCIVTVTQSEVVATWVQQNQDQTAVTSKGPVTVIADPLYMVWHVSDTSMHAVSEANSLRAAMGMAVVTETGTTSLSTSAPTITMAPPTASTISDTATKLSGGAIAGVVIGFIVCLIAIGVLAYFACIRHRSRSSPSEQAGPAGGPGNSSVCSSREIYGQGALQLQTSMQNTTHKTPSFVDLHRAESAQSHTPQTPRTPQMLSRAKEEDMYVIEQKMLLR